MAKMMLTPQPLLGGVDLTLGQNRLIERDDLALVSIAVPLGGDADLTKALKTAWGLAGATPKLSCTHQNHRLVQMTADQFLLIFPRKETKKPNETAEKALDAEAAVQDKLKGCGYTTDQSDAFIALDISGPDTLAALERICPLDLSDAVFPVNSAARTVMEHMSATLIRIDQTRFWVLSASSSAGSFLNAVETSYRHVLA